MTLLIKNLRRVISGSGFKLCDGRKPHQDSLGILDGPVDIRIDQNTGTIIEISKDLPKENSIVFNGAGLLATAAFIDSHTHFIFSGNRANEYFLRWAGKSYLEISQTGGGIHNTISSTQCQSEDDLADKTWIELLKTSQSGVGCIEIKSGYSNSPEGELKLLRAIKKLKIKSNESFGPKIFSTFLGLHSLPKDLIEEDFVDKMISILPIVLKENLADFVDAFPEKGFFSLNESLRFAVEAKKLGIQSKFHADELSDLNTASTMAKLNAISVDHLQQISEQGIKDLANSSTVATLLPATSFYLGLTYAPARALLDAGAKVALATDYNPGTSPSYSMGFTALLAASQFKMSPAEILCAITFNGASALSCQNTLGTLQVGQIANLCLWASEEKTALADLECLLLDAKNPMAVFLSGKKLGS